MTNDAKSWYLTGMPACQGPSTWLLGFTIEIIAHPMLSYWRVTGWTWREHGSLSSGNLLQCTITRSHCNPPWRSAFWEMSISHCRLPSMGLSFYDNVMTLFLQQHRAEGYIMMEDEVKEVEGHDHIRGTAAIYQECARNGLHAMLLSTMLLIR